MTKTYLSTAPIAGVLALALFASVLAPMRAPLAAPAAAEVKIDNFTFAPQRLTVKVGTTVTWLNEDDIPHTIVATGLEFRSKVLDTDDKFSFTFTTAGTFAYFCSLHPHMTGTIVVESAAAGGGAAP
jgi:plastocyanin